MPDDPLATLVDSFRDPVRFPHPVTGFELVETHISYVLLTGPYAYKFKKPLKLDFLDFSTLELRHHYCEEELRLNRRLAPDIYIAVVAVTGTPQQPQLGGDGPVIDYALKMRQFDQTQRWDRLLPAGAVTADHVMALAQCIARFHREVAVASADNPHAATVHIHGAMAHNDSALQQCRPSLAADLLPQLSERVEQLRASLAVELETRLARGQVRECHGDLHLANIALLDGKPLVFDCIEFNPSLRWIDVISEVAFLHMDLTHRGRPDLGWRFINSWLAHSGDYAGLRLLPLYLAYRAMVRGKVACIRSHQEDCDADERLALQDEMTRYLEQAGVHLAPRQCYLLITCGLSGSGKSTVATYLADQKGIVHLRSDVERKRLVDLGPLARSGSATDGGLYSPAMHRSTYERLAVLAREVLEGGHPVVVDAAFLQRKERDRFHRLAEELNLPFRTLYCSADPDLLRTRVARRLSAGTDPSEADVQVLQRQMQTAELPGNDEQQRTIPVDTSSADTGAVALRLLDRELD